MKLLALFIAALFLISCKGKPEEGPAPEAKPSDPPSGPVVVIETSMGTIKAQLHEGTAPLTAKNFLRYVDEKFYDNTIFHRVIPTFMIQGGGFEIPKSTIKQKAPGDPIRNESKHTRKNTRGTLAMARTPDPHSATAQFFISVVDNASLDYPNNGGGYAVFGEVIEGMEIVDQIKAVETHTTISLTLNDKLFSLNEKTENVPVEPVSIKSIRRVSPSE
ncbi:MAG: cyclophilin family peptidyl-prolyl cis-trans isomerase [Paracoccaceae bacterium]|jgi:peptidyl-prolyl cis-trans isomerase B (cyclophilin B)